MPQGNYAHFMYIEFPFSVDEGRGGNVLLIPVPPEQIVASVDGNIARHSIVSLGEVLTIGNRRLQSFGFESHFPSVYDPNIEVALESEHVDPLLWREAFVRVLDSRSPVRVSIENFAFDHLMAVNSFKYSVIPGPQGDLWYQIEMTEFREGFMRIVKGAEIPTSGFRQRPYGDLPNTYTTRPNQTLQDVSALLYGTMDFWSDILAANYVKLIVHRDIPTRHVDSFEGVGNAQRDSSEGVGELWKANDPLPVGFVLTIPRPAGISRISI